MKHINVLISFLSPIRLTKSNQIDKKHYPELEADGFGATHTTNESGIRYLLNHLYDKGEGLDGFIFMLSEKVRNKAISDTVPDFAMTHFEYILQRLAEITRKEKNVLRQDFVQSVDYDEGAAEDISAGSVLETVNAVLKFQNQSMEKEGTLPDVKIYLDLTGGPRDANMLLLIISRMLAYYKGITIEDVIYSNLDFDTNTGRVQHIQGAYHLLDLVAGVYEFNQSGSVTALENYFKMKPDKAISPALDELVSAMRFFSECILLCRYGEFVTSIKRLKAAIQDFENSSAGEGSDLSFNLLMTLIPTIRSKYDELFKAVSEDLIDDIKIFRWCHDNNCLQQAITLITERTPVYLLSDEEGSGFMTVAKDKQGELEDFFKKRDEVKNNFSCWLLFVFNQRYSTCWNAGLSREKLNTLVFKQVLINLATNKFNEEKIEQQLTEIKSKAQYDILADWQKVRQNIKQFIIDYQGMDINGKLNLETVKNCGIIMQHLAEQPSAFNYSLKNFIKKFSAGNIKPLRDIDAFTFVGVDWRLPQGNFGSVANMLDNGVLQTACDKHVLKELLALFYDIKDERNSINHAHNEEQRLTFTELKEKIWNFVDCLEALRKNEEK